MANYEPERLLRDAERLYARAGYVAFVYAVLGFFCGLPFGGLAVVGIHFLRRLESIRTHEDAAELTHTDGLVSLFNHAPIGALLTGLSLCAVGLAIGLARSTELRVQGQTALCLLKIETNTRR